MTTSIEKSADLGFTLERLPPGLHICQIIGQDEERQEAVLKFLWSGLQANERACCFSDKLSKESIKGFLEDKNISFLDATASETLTLLGARDTYFADGRFDPDRMLKLLGHFYDESVSRGYSGARVIGEMTPEVQWTPGGSRLLEYKARVSVMVRTHPVTAVCQYDARDFNGSAILDVLKVHPLMIVRGSVIHNPFFLAPEQFLP